MANILSALFAFLTLKHAMQKVNFVIFPIGIYPDHAYQTLPIVMVAFLEDNSAFDAFVSDLLLCFEKWRSTFIRV